MLTHTLTIGVHTSSVCGGHPYRECVCISICVVVVLLYAKDCKFLYLFMVLAFQPNGFSKVWNLETETKISYSRLCSGYRVNECLDFIGRGLLGHYFSIFFGVYIKKKFACSNLPKPHPNRTDQTSLTDG